MNPSDLKSLYTLTNIAFQREQAAIQPILDRETRIRRALAKLDDQARAARENPGVFDLMRPCGADVAWNAWLGRTRRQLNMELAEVMAQKLQKMDSMRLAFGKKEVAKKLRNDAEACRKQKTACTQQRQAMRYL